MTPKLLNRLVALLLISCLATGSVFGQEITPAIPALRHSDAAPFMRQALAEEPESPLRQLLAHTPDPGSVRQQLGDLVQHQWITVRDDDFGPDSLFDDLAGLGPAERGLYLDYMAIMKGEWLQRLLDAFGKTPRRYRNSITSIENIQTRVSRLYLSVNQVIRELGGPIQAIDKEEFLAMTQEVIVLWISKHAKENPEIKFGTLWNRISYMLVKAAAKSYGLPVEALFKAVISLNDSRRLELPKENDEELRAAVEINFPHRKSGDRMRANEISADDMIFNKERLAVVLTILRSLSPRHEKIIRMHFGITGYNDQNYDFDFTLREIASHFKLTRASIRLYEAQALRHLWHSEFSSRLRSLISGPSATAPERSRDTMALTDPLFIEEPMTMMPDTKAYAELESLIELISKLPIGHPGRFSNPEDSIKAKLWKVSNDEKETYTFRKFLYDYLIPMVVEDPSSVPTIQRLDKSAFRNFVLATFVTVLNDLAGEFVSGHPKIRYKGIWRQPLQTESIISEMMSTSNEITAAVWEKLQVKVRSKFFDYIGSMIDGFQEGWNDPGDKPRLEAAIEKGLNDRAKAQWDHNVAQWHNGDEPMTMMPHPSNAERNLLFQAA